MPFTDLLRLTVFITAGEATALGAITALAAGRDDDTTTVIVAAVWWLAAVAIGVYLGRSARAADGVRDALAQARTATSLPPESPARIASGPTPLLTPRTASACWSLSTVSTATRRSASPRL